MSFFKKHTQNVAADDPVFQKSMIVDVTDFSAQSPDDSLGYMAFGPVSVFEDGTIEIRSINDNTILESFSVLDTIMANDNIGNYHPDHLLDVKIITAKKCYRFIADTKDDKTAFWNSLTSVYDRLKKSQNG